MKRNGEIKLSYSDRLYQKPTSAGWPGLRADTRRQQVTFGHGVNVIIPLLKDKHGDSSKLEMYRGITLSPSIAKLFELVLAHLYEDQLFTDDLKYGFKKQHGCTVYL